MIKENTEMIFGIHSIIEAIKSGKEIEKILIKKGLQGDLYYELQSIIRKLNIPFQLVPIEKINRETRKNHQGVIAYVSQIQYQNIEEIVPLLFETGKTPLILLLDQISDVRNFGAISRSAECAGVDAIIIPTKGAAQINADAIKTSAGALHNINICRSTDFKKTIKFLQESGIQIVAATEKADVLYYDIDFTPPTAIIMGSEDTGIYIEYLKTADKHVKIPIFGSINSLNVSVAAGIIIFEAVKQRNKN